MEKTEVIEKFFANLELDVDIAAEHIADNFNFVLPIPFPLGKSQALMFFKLAKKSLPDLKYNLSNVIEKDGKVQATLQLTGTHTIDFAFPGMNPIVASNNKVTLPSVNLEFGVADDKVTEMKMQNFPMGDISGMLKNMGINLPKMN